MLFDVAKPVSTETLVYQYGVRIDKDCLAHFHSQLDLAHRTYNEIVACIRRIAEEALHWLEQQAGSEVQQLRIRIDLLNQRFKEAKAIDDREACESIAEERRSIWRLYYEHMHKTRRAHGSELNRRFLNLIGERTECPTYQIRCKAVEAGLGWATASGMLKAAIQAFRKQWPKFKQPNFRKGIEVTQQLVELQFTTKGGVSVGDLLAGKHNEIALENFTAGRRQYGSFRFRLGAGESKQDITGTVNYHRSLPADAHIKFARLVEKRIGKDRRHYLQLVVTLSGSVNLPVPEGRKDLLALDFGWYYEDDGRRLAGITDGPDPGLAKIERLPVEIDAQLDRAEAHASERDHLRDELVAEIKAVDFQNAPESLREELLGVVKRPATHTAPSRLYRITRIWREEAKDYLPDWLARLEEWRKADKFLWQAHSHISRRARNARRKHYESLALSILRDYRTVVIDSPELAQVAKVKNKTTGKHNPLGAQARSGRQRTALYEFRQALNWAAARTGGIIADIKGRTSKTCSHCGGRAVPQEDNSRVVICQDCGAITDRECNAAAVIWQNACANQAALLVMAQQRQEEQAATLLRRAASKQARQTALNAAQAKRRDARTQCDSESPEGSRTPEKPD